MTKTKPWYVYIVEAENGNLYTGITTDLQRRFQQHQTQQNGARFFRTSRAKTLRYQEQHPNRSSASKREASIKKLSREAKLMLIGEGAQHV